MRRLLRHTDGVALVAVLLAISLLSTIAMGLAVSSTLDRHSTTNYDERVMLLNAAESALELAARELSLLPAWDGVLQGLESSTLVDGPPGVRDLGGSTIDLIAATNALTCGRAIPCSDAQVHAMTSERPWGENNPRWQLFVHQPLDPGVPMPHTSDAVYVVVWIGDDAGEVDGDPARDGAGPAGEGRYIVRARAEAFGPRGGRQAVEAELSRVCAVPDGGEPCLPGIRVQSWHVPATVP